MEILIGLAIVVGLYLWLRRGGKQAEERKELRVFHHSDDTPDDIISTWLVDLSEMKARYKFQVAGSGPAEVRIYFIRRTDDARWQVKPTRESWEAEYQLQQRRATESFMKEFAEERLEALKSGPTWGDLGEEMTGPLESQYQRFVRQYREA